MALPYCTYEDIQRVWNAGKVAGLVLDGASESVTDVAPQQIFADAIAYAQAEMDRALSPWCSVPLTASPVPDVVRILTAKRALLELIWRRPDTITEADKLFAEGVKAEIEAIRKGELPFGVTQTRGLPVMVGGTNPLSSRMYEDGVTDPDTLNEGLTDPLAGF